LYNYQYKYSTRCIIDNFQPLASKTLKQSTINLLHNKARFPN